MSDQRLRELERLWRESGSPEAEAEVLRERVRAGMLGEDRLRLAAFLGHVAARLAAQDPPTPPEPAAERWVLWGRELARLDEQASVRCAVAIARHVLPRLAESDFADDVARDCVGCAERWALDPGDPDLERDARAAMALRDGDAEEHGFPTPAARHALAAARMAASAAGGRREGSATAQALIAGQALLGTAHAVLAVVRGEVAPWALGYADPVVDRVADEQEAS